MRISPARLAAFQILHRIETERAFSSVLLPAYEEKLEGNDRGLCHELVLGSLRRQIYLDALAHHFVGAKRLDTEVLVALRLGLYQLVVLDKIPPHAAINDSVNLVALAKKSSAKGLVNAVLRRVSEGVPELSYRDEFHRISVETSHPRWLIEKWSGEFGSRVAEEIAAANNVVPRVTFRYTSKADGEKEQDFESCRFVDGCRSASSIDDVLRSMADRGEIYFQDEGSQLVAQAVASRPVGRFLDVCAAPGGKTTQIAADIPDASVVAGDLYSSRVELLNSTCRRQGLDRVSVLQYDAEAGLPFADESFDTVLVDAPCSGTGTIRHNPELRYFLDQDDFAGLASKQRTILRNASKLVRPGGRIIYSTCSLEVEENEAVCSEFLVDAADFCKASPTVPAVLRTGDGFARMFPHRDGTDGFFIAEFDRRRT